MIHTGDCIDVMAGMEPESVDAIVTDPPYGLEFMGKEWDRLGTRKGNPFDPSLAIAKDTSSEPRAKDNPWQKEASGYGAPQKMPKCGLCGKWKYNGSKASQCACPEPRWVYDTSTYPRQMQESHTAWATAALRVAKPGSYLLAFGGTRTVHRLTVALEDAGWIIRDLLVWAYACLSDDTEILTSEGWVRYNSASEGQHAAAFDPTTGSIRWESIQAVHRYHHEGEMAVVGPSLVTLNHRVVIDEDAAAVPCLPGLWNDVHEARRMVAEGARAGLLQGVQRQAATAGPALPHRDASGLDRGLVATLSRVDERPQEPRLEGRRYRVQEAWELLGRPLRAEPRLGSFDGSERWLPDGTSAGHGGALRLPDDAHGVRQPREPRPDRQPPREPDALAGQSDAQALRMGQGPRGYGEPDAVRVSPYVGTVWCITVPSGAFVARRNGVVFVTGNSGFPKSKSSLKPAWEPIVMARKPGPLRELAIDATRLPTSDGLDGGRLGTRSDGWDRPWKADPDAVAAHAARVGENVAKAEALGRWPANVILTDPIFDGDRGFDGKPRWDGVVGGGEVKASVRISEDYDVPGATYSLGRSGTTPRGHGDTGTYSRFFLIPKASRGDREPLLPGQVERREYNIAGTTDPYLQTTTGPDRSGFNRTTLRENTHPTVKPLELMRHLVRLVTPQGGTCLDPFLGSGTTALAAEQEGFAWVGIEREPEYVAIAEARLALVQRGLGI